MLAILCVIAVGLSVMALRGQGVPPSATIETSSPPVPTPGDPASATSTGRPDDADLTTAAASVPDVDGWVEAWAGPGSDLLVVGDGFSNLPTQWVQLWATVMSADRPVTIHHWGEAEDISFNPPILLSDRDGDALGVWSASRDGTTIADAAEHMERFLQAADTPEAVLVSLGQASAGEDIADGLDQLVGEIDEGVPVLVAIGPAGLYEAGVGDALLEWAQAHDDRVSVVDLRGEAPDTASAEQWADAFDAAITGS